LKRRTGSRAHCVALAAASGVLALLSSLARAGHESPFYPSFYPQEIRLEVLAPSEAAAGWAKPLVHAYAGSDLFAQGKAPADAAAATSLRALVVLSFDATAGRYAAGRATAAERCAAATRIVPLLDQVHEGYVFHPYPITPYHADYLAHADRALMARSLYQRKASDFEPAFRVRAQGPLAQSLVPASSGLTDWDATVEEVDIDQLAPPEPQGVLGQAPWLKQGWFQTYRLYAQAPAARAAAMRAASDYQRLTTGAYRDEAERVNLERALVAALGADCERVVVGYALRKEYFNTEYSVGVENVGADSQAGLASAIFPRTVKLKDFPWNGWLRVGLAAPPEAAWNPVAGLNDRFGRLLWDAVGDPALLPEPYGGGWIANRGEIAADGTNGPASVPTTALRPELGSGVLHQVGAGKTARQRLRYSLVSSAFHDGSAPAVADILYPYIFAFRWGDAGHSREHVDPEVARSTERIREWLAGFRVITIETRKKDFGSDLVFTYRVPVVDVYLARRADDRWAAGAAAPPWSTLPWNVIVLMEEAVTRGIAAFSRQEAQRRGIPWLDLARDKAVGAKLAELVETFRREGYRPEALKSLVSVDEAQERWASLAAFHDHYGHFLVTNGPYRLDSWTAEGATLQVFRDLGYPLGVGAFDAYAIPLRGYVSSVEDRGGRLTIDADVERVVRSQRSYDIERVPLPGVLAELDEEERPVCAYILSDRAGKVLQARSVRPDPNGRFVIDLRGLTTPGMYTVAAAVVIGGNRVNPEVRLIEHRVAVAGASQRSIVPTIH
jgi:hypothetical protein